MALTYHIKTYGCQMNYSDSERIMALLEAIGYEESVSEDDADFLIFNTCSIRKTAEDRVFGLMRKLAAMKKTKKDMTVAITGCMVQKTSSKESKERDQLVDKFDPIDIVFRIDEMAKLPILINEVRPHLSLRKPGEEIDEGTLQNYFKIAPKHASGFQAWVPIMTGCDKFCAFCIVPYTRGRERSRAMQEVYDECKKLVEGGAVEITLLGQNVNSYGLSGLDRTNGFFEYDEPKDWPWKVDGRSPFATLLRKIDKLKAIGLHRVRWTSPHPRDMTDDVLDAVLELDTQMPYIHMPIQAGNDEMLKRMNRPYTVDKYRGIVERIRERIPDCSISTDIIVGFCGETEDQFEDVFNLYREIRWDMAYISQYSMRRFTLANKTMKDDVPKVEKARRWHKLNKILTECSFDNHKKFVGREVEVLVERFDNGICEGRSEHFKKTQFPGGPEMVGQFVKVKITDAKEWNLIGEAS